MPSDPSTPTADQAAPLAVRWRPRSFDDVVGQRAPLAVLRAAAGSENPPRQLLLVGGSGLGKTTLGRIYAAALCCEEPPEPGTACGTCRSCVDVLTPGRTHPDVTEVDAASAGGKDEILRLAASAHTAPLRSKWRIWIIDEAHGISRAGLDAFLKLLEEPPPQVCFVLATTEVDRMPATLRGRCLELRLATPSRDELAANLARVAEGEGWELDEEIISLVLDATDPELGVRGTLTTLGRLEPLIAAGSLDADLAASVLGVATAAGAGEVLDAVAAGRHAELFDALERFVSDFGEPAARRRLLDASLQRLRAAADRSAPTAAAARTLELLADAAPGRLGLSVALARAATPPAPTDPEAAAATEEALRAAVTEANAAIDALTAATAAAPAPQPATAPRAAGDQGEAFYDDGAPPPPEPPEGGFDDYDEPPPSAAPRASRRAPAKKATAKKSAGKQPSKKAPAKKGPRKRTGTPRIPAAVPAAELLRAAEEWFADPASSTTRPAAGGGSGTDRPAGEPGQRTARPPKRPAPAGQVGPSGAAGQGGLSARAQRRDIAAQKVLGELRRRSRPAAGVLSACTITDCGGGVLRIVVPPERVDDARRGGFRELVEAAAAVAGFDEVQWRRPAQSG